LSLLAASVSFSGLTITGSVSLAPTDTSGDGKLQPSELLRSNVTPTISFTPNPLTFSITATVGPRVQVGATDLPGPLGTVTATMPSLFGHGSGPSAPQVSFNTSLGSGADLLSNFSNAGPNEILGMLSQITDFLASMASQQILQTSIPFTHVTIGSALDYA